MRKSMRINKNITLLFFILLALSLSACGGGNKEYNPDGSLKSIGKVLPNGKKDGEWQTFYHSGSPMSKGTYNKGEKEGRWTYWNKDGNIVARKHFKNGIEVSETEKEAAPKITKKHTTKPEPKAKHAPEAEPKAKQAAKHKAEVEPETTATDEVKRTEPYVENSSGFAATMEEWKSMKIRKEQMPQVEAPAETTTEEVNARAAESAPEHTPEPAHEPAPIVSQKEEISEPVQTEPIKEVVVQPIAETTEPAEPEVEPAKAEAPAQKKKPLKSGGKFWRN